MALPELYRYGREGLWFGTVPFIIYMLEGVYQVSCSVQLAWRTNSPPYYAERRGVLPDPLLLRLHHFSKGWI